MECKKLRRRAVQNIERLHAIFLLKKKPPNQTKQCHCKQPKKLTDKNEYRMLQGTKSLSLC